MKCLFNLWNSLFTCVLSVCDLLKIALQVTDNIEEHKSMLKFFMQKFCTIIKTMDSTYKELSIAIRGYGFFAAVCASFALKCS